MLEHKLCSLPAELLLFRGRGGRRSLRLGLNSDQLNLGLSMAKRQSLNITLYILRTRWDRYYYILRTLWDRYYYILRTGWDRSYCIDKTLWDRSYYIFRTLWDGSYYILRTLWVRSYYTVLSIQCLFPPPLFF